MIEKKSYVGVEKIAQKNSDIFFIKWTDGIYQEFSLKALQENCPCVRCQEKEKAPISLISAYRIYSVGRYALQIDFTSGCSRGLYTYAYLRGLKS